jgi:hypothetical protein
MVRFAHASRDATFRGDATDCPYRQGSRWPTVFKSGFGIDDAAAEHGNWKLL